MNVLIAGGGLAGLVLAPQLVRQGHTVTVIERARMEDLARSESRSINLTLTANGRAELHGAGLLKRVAAIGTMLDTRRVHAPGGESVGEHYATEPSGNLMAVKRSELLALLLENARASGVAILEETAFQSYDKRSNRATLLARGETIEGRFDLLVGADGAFSAVRREMLRGEPISFAQNFFPWRYVKFDLSPAEVSLLKLDVKELHVWSASEALTIGIPNRDGSVSAILMFACGEEETVAQTLAIALRNLKGNYPDLVRRIGPRVVDAAKVEGYFNEVRLHTWVWSDRIVLIGDAAHAMYPFCGLGFNTALGDVGELVRQLARPVSVCEALRTYQRNRRPVAEQARLSSERQFAFLHRTWNSALLRRA